MLASPLTATICLPLLPLLAAHFKVSQQAINLTVAVYIVAQAVSPLLFATASGTVGRRPTYLATYALYTIASLGLALNKHSYATLVVLRALQSLGASAALAIAFDVVADVCSSAERGAMLAPIQGAANLAVCLGPVIGGLIALRTGGIEWVFWALMIFGAMVFSIVTIALPETARNMVGNGSLKTSGWAMTWWSVVRDWVKERAIEQRSGGSMEKGGASEKTRSIGEESKAKVGKMKEVEMPSPLAAIQIIFWRDTALVLWMAASPYAVWYCVQTSIPTIYQNIYGFNDFQIGLAYLTGGAGTVIGGYATGRLMEWNYKTVAKQIGHNIDMVSGNDLDHFPIEKARARGSWWLLALYICALASYGWSAVAYAHQSVPLILQFVLAALCTSFQQTYNALLVDILPASASTAAASSNITRCALSAVAVAVLQPLVNAIGRGWFFTLLACLSGGGGLATNWAINTHGFQWRQQRLAKTKGPRECSQP